MPNALRLLVVEDEQELREILVQGLAKRGFNVAAAADGDAGLATLSEQEFDVVILDLRMPRRDGIQVLQQMRTDGHDAEVIIVTGHADIETAVDALKLHAFDYLSKPFQMAELLQIAARPPESRRFRLETRSLRRAVSQHEIEPLLYGSSRAMDRLRGLLDRASQSASNVLILGESGSGKELAARSIHRGSARRDLPFLALNCAALPDELLESELFGHERGAFTGATARRHGLLELAHMGTLFLDEVGEMSVAMRPSSCAPSIAARSGDWAATAPCTSTCASSPRRTATWPRPCPTTSSVTTSITGSGSSSSRCRRYASGWRTSRSSWSTSPSRWRRPGAPPSR